MHCIQTGGGLPSAVGPEWSSLTDRTESNSEKDLFLSSGLARLLGRDSQNEVVIGKFLDQSYPTELSAMMEVLYLCCPVWQSVATCGY